MLLNDREQLLQGKGLADPAHRADLLRGRLRLFSFGHHHYRWIEASRSRLARKSPPVEHWHAHIEEDQ
jgi:hypothetical protein